MILECFAAIFGCPVAGVWFFSYELFFDGNVILQLQGFGMTGQITVGNAQ